LLAEWAYGRLYRSTRERLAALPRWVDFYNRRRPLAVFTAVTILGWVMFGAKFWLGYLDKGIEIALIVALLIEMYRYDGGPVAVFRRGIDLAVKIVRYPFSGRSQA